MQKCILKYSLHEKNEIDTLSNFILLYKFISKQLVFAYDNKKTLTLNSANILIPKLEDYPIKTILALFNSSLFQFIYQKKFNTLKVLRSDIESLPLPVISPPKHKKIEKLVKKIMKNELKLEDRKKIYTELDNAIMDIFSLNSKEKEYVLSEIKSSDKLLDVN